MTRPALALAACLAMLASPSALAHSGAGIAGGFAAGFLHPLGGTDHLLAMIAVGIWGATLGKPLIYSLPITFPLLMVVGGVLGITGVPLPFIESGIAASVIALGLAIALAWRAPVAAALVIVGVFGIFHGHAHGTELPESAAPTAYAAGFVVATGLLHLTGILIGLLKQVPRGETALRAGGGAIALTGLWILIGAHGAA